MHSDFPDVIESGTLENGETRSLLGPDNANFQVVKVTTTKGNASVSVLGGLDPNDNTNYMSYVVDRNGQFQGTDFITRSHAGGFLYFTGLQEDTAVEVREASTEELQSVQYLDAAQIVNVNPDAGIWRIRADKEITVAVGQGSGGTFIPLTENTTGTTPYPPVIAGVRWNPYFPRTSDTEINVSFLTDEACNATVNYKIGEGPWYRTSEGPLGTEHLLPIIITGLTEETVVRLRPEARDQSGSVTVDNNRGADYVVTVRKDAPDLDVSLSLVIPDVPSYKLRFFVQNMGAGAANNVELILGLEGMQPYTDGVVSNYGGVAANLLGARVPVPTLSPGGSTFVDIDLYPYINHLGSADYRLFSTGSVAKDDFGHSYTEDYPAVTHDFDDAAIEAELADTRYVVLANLFRFYTVHDPNSAPAQRMPREMAFFAKQRGATLAYIASGDPGEIRSYIQGRFNGKVDDSWRDAGYLLLVGCSTVMPAFGWTLDCAFTDEFQLWMSDNTYANLDNDDHFTPELVIGRITGDHPDTYSKLFERALTPNYFDKSVAVSGTGDGEDQFSSNASECRNLFAQLYHDSTFHRLELIDDADRSDVYFDNANNTDFFYYRNHGYIRGWDYFRRSSVSSMNFGSKYPIVYSNSCLTGQVQTNNNLAEEFLARSAAVFIGATEVSPRSANNSLGKKITTNHKNGSSIGRAFRDGKRSLAGDIHWYTTCWQDQVLKRNILMYNIYGDPFRGTILPFPKADKAKTTFDPPVETLNVTIPMYEVIPDISGVDTVNIPDEERGGHLDVVKEPLVPNYRITATYEPGIRVNDIQMVSRSGETHESGLNLPVSWWNQKVEIGPDDGPSPGTFPTDAFHWTGIERLDGGQEVLLTIHPFFYNATTQDATFYQNYTFHIDFVTTTVTIDSVTPTYEKVPVGLSQTLDVRISNNGAEEVQVDLSLDIENMGTNDVVSTQSQNGLALPAGGFLVRQFNWDPTGSPQTHYQVAARVRRSADDAELDAGFNHFRVGVPELAIKSFTLETQTPGYVDEGEVADLLMEIQSVGDMPNHGTMTIQIRNALEGNIVADWENKFASVVPAATLVYEATWDSLGIPKGNYHLIGWVEHEGGVTDQEIVSFQTLQDMRWGWNSIQDIYLHGDKIVGVADLLHNDGSVVGLVDSASLAIELPDLSLRPHGLTSHASAPHYSTNLIVNALEPSGLYALVANATKVGYRDAEGVRHFVVTENPFSMTANPGTAVADGQTTIHVQSEVVSDASGTVADGTLLTLDPLVGEIATADAAPGLSGIQVASVSGVFEFDWRSPTRTALDAFTHGFFGGEGPQTGISALFKGIDFNGNRRVDVADIGFVRAFEGDLEGVETFDQRADLNGDGVVDGTDTEAILDRWALEFSDAIRCATCLPEPKSYGVKIRPEPDRALIPPGGSLTIEIVAEGLDNLGGYEFGSVLVGDSLDWMGVPEQNLDLKGANTLQQPLGPIAYGEGGYRIGSSLYGSGPGPSGKVVLATLSLSAQQTGETRLILSAPVLVRFDGQEQAVLQTVEGVYSVGTPTPTPTATLMTAPTPTGTSTPQSTPNVTPRPAGDFDIWPTPQGDGEIDARDLLDWLERMKAEQAEEEVIFDFARFWKGLTTR
jgi:hypothetical protein